jgi:hypothetical protein
MSTPKSISELIAKWPTIGDFAHDVGCGYEAARQMRRRESIAPEHWHSVLEASRKRGLHGVSLDWLAKQRVRARIVEQARAS